MERSSLKQVHYFIVLNRKYFHKKKNKAKPAEIHNRNLSGNYMQVNVHDIYVYMHNQRSPHGASALKGIWSIVFLSFVEVFTKLALRFGDAANIQSSYQQFHLIFQKVSMADIHLFS